MNQIESLWDIVGRSLYISGTAVLLAAAWSIPLAYYLASRSGGRLVAPILEALVGIPTVLIGLLLYMLLSRNGPLGSLGLLYTKTSIILGEAILITPLITAVSYRILKGPASLYRELALTLGASPGRAAILALRQSVPGLLGAAAMGFSRAVGELGVALIVGGNIRGETRTVTTAIALATSMGEYEAAIKLGAILVVLTIGISIAIRLIMREWEE